MISTTTKIVGAPSAPAAAVSPAATGTSDELADQALLAIGRYLKRAEYRFATVTPDTHRVVNARSENAEAHDLRGVFGWSRPFRAELLAPQLLSALARAEALEEMSGGLLRSRVRFSTVEGNLLVHSAHPTSVQDAVFLGPDTYRFISLLRRTLAGGRSLLELGTGTAAAVLCMADRYDRLQASDHNPRAVRYARVNAELAGCHRLELVCGDLAAGVQGPCSAIIINPPYLIDPHGPSYRDGGMLGFEVALSMLNQALPLLAHDGRLVLYTGAPVVAGYDLFATALAPILHAQRREALYEVIDIDIFGSWLAHPAYAGIERIALVAVVVGALDGAQLATGEE